MKQISRWRHDLQNRRRLRKQARRRRRQNKVFAREKAKHLNPERRHVKDKAQRYANVRAPMIIALFRKESHAALVQMIKSLKHLVINERKRVRIDFRGTQKLYADGTLLLFAELESMERRLPGSITCTLSNTKLVNEAFKHIGLFELLNLDCKVTPKSDSATGWHFWRGTSADFEAAGPDLERIATPEVAPLLFVGLGEAATNTGHHAYKAEREDGYGIRETKGWWWMFYRVNAQKGHLTVVFCDLGAGIPRTIETTLRGAAESSYRLALSLALRVAGLSTAHDGTIIQAAVQAKRSSTGLSHRGKGLGQIRHVIESIGTGKLMIYSNAGVYRLDRDRAGKESESSMKYSESIYGTMIGWTIPLREGKR